MLLMKLLLLMLALCFPRTEPPRLVQKPFTLFTRTPFDPPRSGTTRETDRDGYSLPMTPLTAMAFVETFPLQTRHHHGICLYVSGFLSRGRQAGRVMSNFLWSLFFFAFKVEISHLRLQIWHHHHPLPSRHQSSPLTLSGSCIASAAPAVATPFPFPQQDVRGTAQLMSTFPNQLYSLFFFFFFFFLPQSSDSIPSRIMDPGNPSAMTSTHPG